MNHIQLRQALLDGAFDKTFEKLYLCSGEALAPCRQRYADAVTAFHTQFGDCGALSLFSAPGRTEICGNHTDHQGGGVVAGSINLDIIAVAAPRTDGIIRLQSEGFPMEELSLQEPDGLSPRAEEQNTSASLLRGIAAKFIEMGYPVTGFDAYTTSNVPRGSGLSSSAAFEVLVGNICNAFFAQEQMDHVEIAQIGQYAENVFFGKPCGLMDQIACSVGGVVVIDFYRDPPHLFRYCYHDIGKICIIDSGADHADLTEAYAAITMEMRSVAEALGVSRLCDTTKEALMARFSEVRAACGDRAVLRALHFFNECRRVGEVASAIRDERLIDWGNIRESGKSSFCYLQNVSTYENPREQAVALTIALCEEFLGSRMYSAARVHGGGFAGTVQAIVPDDCLEEFVAFIEGYLGKGSCHVLEIRDIGGVQLKENGECREFDAVMKYV